MNTYYLEKLDQTFRQSWFRHTLIILSIVGVTQLGAQLLRSSSKQSAFSILAHRESFYKRVQNGLSNLSSIEKQSLVKLENLSQMIEDRKSEKKTAFVKFFSHHFASVTILLILSTVSVVIVFIAANKGLNNSHPYLKTVFFIMALQTSFYALSPIIFKQEANIETNLSNYLQYDNLQQEIYNYALTDSNLPIDSSLARFNKFHREIIDQMAKLNTIDVKLDNKSIPLPDFGLNPN